MLIDLEVRVLYHVMSRIERCAIAKQIYSRVSRTFVDVLHFVTVTYIGMAKSITKQFLGLETVDLIYHNFIYTNQHYFRKLVLVLRGWGGSYNQL